jgi:hypothetical protein
MSIKDFNVILIILLHYVYAKFSSEAMITVTQLRNK